MTGPVKCTYLDCCETFRTEKEMKMHKKTTDKHDYCRRCDYDAGDWDQLLAHKVDAMAPYVIGDRRFDKVKEPRHIVCEFCGEDFKSFGGRERHRNQQHQADQNIECRATQPVGDERGGWTRGTCGKLFLRPSALIHHYESGNCNFIGPKQFKTLCHQRYIVQQIWQDHTQFLDIINNSRAVRSRSSYCNDDDDASDDVTNDGDLSEASSGGIELDLTPCRVDVLSNDNDNEDQAAHIAAMKPKPGLNVLDMNVPMTNSGSGRLKSEATAQPHTKGSVNNVWHSGFWDPENKAEFNIDFFYHDLIQKYLCPFPNCKAAYLAQSSMEEHLQGAHKPPHENCPSCSKRFGSVAAIVAHFEASQRGGARRCIVARRSDYRSLLYNVTGGFLSGAHVNDDGVAGIKARYVRSGGQRVLKLVRTDDDGAGGRLAWSGTGNDRGDTRDVSRNMLAKAGPGVMKFRYDAGIPDGADGSATS